MRRGAKPGKAKVEPKLPVARKSRKSEGSRVHALEKRLAEALKREAEALEQQTATAEVLKVISRSTFDLQPVLETLVENATRLCGAESGLIWRFDGEVFRAAADYGVSSELKEFWERNPIRPGRGSVTGRAALERRTVQIPDVLADPEYQLAESQKVGGYRTLLGVPMLREGVLIGVFGLQRYAAKPFTDKHIELVKTFADQAVIAVENVRLFKELEARNRDLTEALEQQTATSEILRVISSSPTDLQPVLDTIATTAAQLCDAHNGAIFRFDGEVFRLAATYNVSPEFRTHLETNPIRPGRGTPLRRVGVERRPVSVADVLADPELGHARADYEAEGMRTALAVPMLKENALVGAITIHRREVRPLTDKQIELVATFASQAVIAIENVRLFTELQASNSELTTALDTQTATSDILRVISRSQTDVQPVFDAILTSAVHLLGAYTGALTLTQNQQIELSALTSTDDTGDATVRAAFPQSLQSVGAHPRAIRDRAPLNVADAHTDARLADGERAFANVRGFRSWVVVPMLRDAGTIGSIGVTRREAGGFSADEIALLQMFADQAVIAIENVRLFKELETRTGELTQSVEKLTALGEVSRAVSSTLDVETVLDTIVSRASQLAGGAGCSIFEYDAAAERFELRAAHNDDTAFVEALRAVPLRKGEGLMGRAAEMREPIQIPDITQPGAYQSSVRDTLIRFGYRALLSVPLLREDQIIGSLSFNRKAPGEFPPEIVDVLKTFATQSALAIQNARLFREIADKSAQLEAASRHKSEFLANMSHELRTPLNAIIGFSEVLTERMFGELNEKQDEYLKDIHASGQHLLSLINDILDLSKIEAGRMELEVTDFDLPSAIDNALILVRERATRRGITLGHSVDERLGTIRGDERKVKQVLLNLLSNALKFTPEGGRIDVSAGVHDEVAEIAVADTGVGIAPEDQAVFEEFRQVGTADKKVEGTGLGLALSRKFIELHGGRIWVESEVGKGSTFRFTLPSA
jgi:signal transduction histidine kinase